MAVEAVELADSMILLWGQEAQEEPVEEGMEIRHLVLVKLIPEAVAAVIMLVMALARLAALEYV
jgi:hypothetical protein